jgi:putative membrane protein
MMFIAQTLVAIVAVLHIAFLVLEMFLWTSPLGRKIFGQSKGNAEITKVLAANQGLYNGFLVAGLLWGLLLGASGGPVLIFFLSCVVVAGIYGSATVSRKIFWVQAAPAIAALVVLGIVAPFS